MIARPQENRGHVALVGAGPGDPELITVKGLKLLRQADVVLYDRLAPQELLEEAPSHAERIDVGKHAGRPAPAQPWINALIISKAREGKRVVRLKGGDPFVFGRGGEELVAANEAGIAVEVVPGITAALGIAASLGIPLTHRGQSRSLAFVTAVTDWDHPSNTHGEERQIDLVAHVETLCIYMGLSQVGRVAARLIELGRDPQTPAISVSHGCTPGQHVVRSTLAELADDVASEGLTSPMLTIVGTVVGLPDSLHADAEATA
jgi:uroporphyrin-III C-methyltransferase